MKIRGGFVTNSSTSHFVILKELDLVTTFALLNPQQNRELLNLSEYEAQCISYVYISDFDHPGHIRGGCSESADFIVDQGLRKLGLTREDIQWDTM